MTPADAWLPIDTMPLHRQVLVSDGALVKPAIRVSEASVAAPILMALRMWTHWIPLPLPPAARGAAGAHPMTPADAWQDISTAPRDGTLVWLRLASGYELPATWMRGFETEAGETGAWCAWSERMIPPSWTDAVRWGVNEAGEPSDQPVGWLPAPPRDGDGQEPQA